MSTLFFASFLLVNGIYSTNKNRDFFNVARPAISRSESTESSVSLSGSLDQTSNTTGNSLGQEEVSQTSGEGVSSTDTSENASLDIKKKNESGIDVATSITSNSDGLVNISGRVTSQDIKQLIIRNSIDDQEKVVEVQDDQTFLFDFQMNDASTDVIIRVCCSEYKDVLSVNDWKEIKVHASTEFHQKYIDRLTEDMEKLDTASR